MLEYHNETPDWALTERCRLHQLTEQTHLASDAGTSALRATTSSGKTGTNNSYRIGTGGAVVGGETVSFGSSQSVGIDKGSDYARRDVIYLDSTGSLAVIKGTPAPFSWSDAIAQADRTATNAEAPAPPTLADTPGLVLAVVSVPKNAGFVADDNLTDMRVPAPAVAASGAGYDLTADMSEADVRSAINNAPASTHLRIEDGASWTLDGPLQPAQGVIIEASNFQTGGATFTKGFSGPLVEMAHYVTLKNLVLDGNRSGGYSGPNIKQGTGGANWHVVGCNIINASGDGVVANCYVSRIRNCRIRFNSGYGVRFPEVSGETPHNEISGPCSIARNDGGGIAIEGDGKNTTVHAHIGHNGGPGIYCSGSWRTFDLFAHIAANDGPAWLQDGGNMRATFRSVHFQGNNENPDSSLTAPVGEIQIENGPLNATLIDPWAFGVGQLIHAPGGSGDSGGIALLAPAGGDTNGDITGPNLSLAVMDAAVLSGSVDVGDAIALDSQQQAVRTGGTLANTLGETTLGQYDDATADRSNDTWYQNTTDGPLRAVLWADDSAGGRVSVTAHVNRSQSNNAIGADSAAGDGSSTTHVMLPMLVPNRSYYKFDVTGTLRKWHEAVLS
jgi:hypothetical protein